MLRSELQEDEFQEADILWADDAAEVSDLAPVYYPRVGTDDDDDEYYSGAEPRIPTKLHLRQIASSPIDIPGRKKVVGTPGAKRAEAPARRRGFGDFDASRAGFVAGSGSVDVGSHVFVPPHVLVDRRAKRDNKAMMMLVVPSGRARARKMREQF
ncbi:unnamed protein product [Urochloa humidicola]